ncbi:MAG: acyl-CoA dehydrogenase family protein [Acidimicrobiales bacterium]
MDFTFTDEQQAISDLAYRILSERLPCERIRQLEQTDTWFADDVWAELGQADLLGIALPEADGGGGFGLLEACLIAEQVGRTVAPVPFLSSVVAAALPLAEFGSPAQRERLLPGVISGTATLATALYEPTDVAVPTVPTTRATRDGHGWRLDGEKSLVVDADRAAAILVPARTGETTSAVFLVAPDAPGVGLDRGTAVTGEPQWGVRLDGVTVDAAALVGGTEQGRAIVGWITDRLAAAICATQTGVCEEALAITARYVSEREQFGSKLGTFQAVGQRVADAYIDTEGIRLTALQAIWRLSEGLEAHDELMTAKFWAADGGQRVVHAAQHLHGGIGVALDYPIHRYFRWAKVLELTLGGASPSLLRLGASLAAQPVGSA